VKSLPTYVISRHANWGFVLTNCFAVLTSFQMAPRLRPARPGRQAEEVPDDGLTDCTEEVIIRSGSPPPSCAPSALLDADCSSRRPSKEFKRFERQARMYNLGVPFDQREVRVLPACCRMCCRALPMCCACADCCACAAVCRTGGRSCTTTALKKRATTR